MRVQDDAGLASRERRRILVVAPAYPNLGSFAGVFVADQVHALRPRYDVAVVAPQAQGWRQAVRRLPRIPDGEALRPTARTWVPGSPRSVAAGYVAAVDRVVCQQRRPPDLIHAHVLIPTGHAATVVGRRHGIPVVVTEHSGPLDAILTSTFARNSALATLREAAAVLAVGPDLAAELRAFAPDIRVDVIDNIVDTELFQPVPPVAHAGPARLLAVGIQMPQKGVDVLIDAVRRLVAGGSEVQLTIAGDGPDRPKLEAEASRSGTGHAIRFVGALSRLQLRDAFAETDLFVSSSRHESWGIAIAEAMASGRPAVVTRTPGPASWLIQGTAVVVPPNDPDAIAAAVRGVISGEIRIDLVAARRSIEDRFAPTRIADRLGAVYEAIFDAQRA